MAREIKDLQKLIEERAVKKLEADLSALQKLLQAQHLLGANDLPRLYTKKERNGDTPCYHDTRPDYIVAVDHYGRPSNEYTKQLYNYWLPEYIQKESEEFLAKLDQVQQDVNYLLDNQPSQSTFTIMKWHIQNQDGKYVRLSQDEAGTILMHTNPSCATVFGPCTRDYIDGLCRGLEIGLVDKFKPAPLIHFQKSVNEKVDDINERK